MRENRVKAALKAGKTVVGVGLSVCAHPSVVKIMANAGYDFLFIDSEHNLQAADNLLNVVQMARSYGISPILRTRDSEYHLVANLLDSGADGLIVPRVETRAQAERLVSYAKFPPMGIRGCGTTATLDYKSEDWRQALPWLNEQTLLITQVESPQAIENLPEVVRLPGIDVILVGPLDLSIRLGVPGQFADPTFIAAIDKVIAICQAAGKPCGIVMPNPDACKPWWEKGMRFFSCGNDTGMLAGVAAGNVKGVRAYAGAA